jgi:transcriptional regulator with XRE-family HTH domain
MTPTPEQVRAARKAAGLTQEQAAERAGLGSRTRWAEYEAGTRSMPKYRFDYFKTMSKGGK